MKKSKNLFVVLILIVLFGISVGYAAISRTLSITGNSEVKQNTWNVYFDNVKVINGSVTSNLPVIDTTTKSTVSFNVMLNLPGDFYEFTVDVVNSGTIDAMIDSIIKTPELTDEQKKYFNYIIEYQNGEQIASKQLVEKDSFVRIKVRVEYRTDITENDLPTTSQSLNLGFTLNYVQADSTGSVVKSHGIVGANGDINEIGTIVTIGDQQFYTIGTEGDNVKLLSMYNLYVGNECTSSSSSSCTSYGEEATGKQDSTMLGFVSEQTTRKGTTAFSSSSQKGTKYSDYNGSIVERYVNNYKVILEGEEYGIDVVEARLITYEELISDDIGCDSSNSTCSDALSWIYSTCYWSGSAAEDTYVWKVNSGGYHLDHGHYSYDRAVGVRPVIIISKDYFIR